MRKHIEDGIHTVGEAENESKTCKSSFVFLGVFLAAVWLMPLSTAEKHTAATV